MPGPFTKLAETECGAEVLPILLIVTERLNIQALKRLLDYLVPERGFYEILGIFILLSLPHLYSF